MGKKEKNQLRASNSETQRLRKANGIRKSLHVMIRINFQTWKLRIMKQHWRLKEVIWRQFLITVVWKHMKHLIHEVEQDEHSFKKSIKCSVSHGFWSLDLNSDLLVTSCATLDKFLNLSVSHLWSCCEGEMNKWINNRACHIVNA